MDETSFRWNSKCNGIERKTVANGRANEQRLFSATNSLHIGNVNPFFLLCETHHYTDSPNMFCFANESIARPSTVYLPILDEDSMAFDEASPPKKRWQQQSCSSTPSPISFTLDANQWRHQNVLVLDCQNSNTYLMGTILDISNSHLVTVSLRDQSTSTLTIDLTRPICNHLPSIIIDNIPACQDLLVGTDVCVRQMKSNSISPFQLARIRGKHPTRLEFAVDLKDSNNNQEQEEKTDHDETIQDEKWFIRQHIRLLIEPWHEELRLFRENLPKATLFRPISVEVSNRKPETNDQPQQNSSSTSSSPEQQQQSAFPTPPIENKDEDDEEVERELQNDQQAVNKLQGIKKGDIFTMG